MTSRGISPAEQTLGDRPRALRETKADHVFGAMLEGWARHLMSRGLRDASISHFTSQVRRFRDYLEMDPWEWGPTDFEDFTSHLLSRSKPLAKSTVRHYQGAVRQFCAYVSAPQYGWPALVEQNWGTVPTQICFEWNTIGHLSEFEGTPGRRGLTYDEIERFLACADERALTLKRDGLKGAVAAWRDSEFFKLTYAFGLRRSEASLLSVDDFFSNPDVPQFGRYGALHVRHGKASRGGPPKRRTVLTLPEFDWVVESIDRWLSVGRSQISTAERSRSLWPTERGLAVSPTYISQRFSQVRDEAGLDRELTLHSLRHSYVTHLIEFGYAERFVQDQVGHSHASTTAIYANVTDDFRRRTVMRALEGLIP